MHSQALCFRFQRGQMPDGRNGKLQGWHSSRASHSVLSCVFSRLPIPSQHQTQSCSFTTSSRGLAPPKIAEFGLATWLRGVPTVRGLSWSRGRCALSSSVGSLKSMEDPRRGGPSRKRPLPIKAPGGRRSPGRVPLPRPPKKSSSLNPEEGKWWT